jgi:hypothetical protein
MSREGKMKGKARGKMKGKAKDLGQEVRAGDERKLRWRSIGQLDEGPN